MSPSARPRPRGRRPRSPERGAIAILAMVLMTVIMGFAALSFDLAYVRLARFEMKNAADAGAHAAMHLLAQTKDTTQATSAAISVAGKNTVLGIAVNLATTDVTFGIWDYSSSTFTAEGAGPYNAVSVYAHKTDPSAADGTVNTTFGRVLGVTGANVAQTSVAAFRTRDLMFEMDVTGSFLTSSCQIDAAIAADVAFLDDMYAAGSPKDQIGLDVFVGSASNYTPLQAIQSNYTNIRADWYGDGISALDSAHTYGLGVCQQPGQKTTGNWVCGSGTLWPNQANLKPGYPMPDCWAWDSHYTTAQAGVNVQVYGGTNIGAGIASGITALGNATTASSDVQSIVVFTDGGPLCCESEGGGQLCPHSPSCCADVATGGCVDNGTGACACSQAVYNYGISEATAALQKGIDVYVLAFGGYTPWINYAKLLPRGRGFEIDTSDPTQLAASLKTIANNIPVALVN